MSRHHGLAPLRRWLVDQGLSSKLFAVLLASALVMVVAAVAIRDQAATGESAVVDFENSTVVH